MSLGIWRVSDRIIEFLKNNLTKGSTILELGSGDGTKILSKDFKMYSIEDDLEWVNKYKSIYLHVPLLTYTEQNFPKSFEYFKDDNLWWYNPKVLQQQLSIWNPQYSAIVIDGPKGYRGGMLDCIEYFNTDALMLFDDIHDKWHFKLMSLISDKINRPFQLYYGSGGTVEFGVIMPKNN